MTLDDEDCAHLDAIQRQRVEQLQHIRQSMDDELALFRAAKADRSQSQLVLEDEEDSGNMSIPLIEVQTRQSPTPLLPTVIIKKKRLCQQPDQYYDVSSKKPKAISKENFVHSTKNESINRSAIPKKNIGIADGRTSGLSLLGGYGSSSDSG